MAALSLVAWVTLGASKIVSMGGKLAGHAKSIETIGKLVSNTASFAICAEQTVSSSAAMWNKYHEKGAKLSGETALEILGIGLNVAGMAASGKGIIESGNRLGKMVKEGGTTNKMSKGISKSGSNTALTVYDPEFAARQMLVGGETSEDLLMSIVTKGTPNIFVPTSTIKDGYKYNFSINGKKVEIKWHSQGLNAAIKYPGSNSGAGWTAQIKVENKLLTQSGRFVKKPQNFTHIPLKGGD